METGQAPRRAHSLPELAALSGQLFVREEIGAAISGWRPRADDVVITPFGKCGTTWLQQTFHTLRTGGDMDFDDISRVVPWIETATVCGLDLNAEQRAQPRGYKSHLPYEALPPGAKAVVAFRHPHDAMASLYNFMSGWFLEPGAVPLEDFAAAQMAGGGGPDYWAHLLSWWGQRANPRVLLLTYEGMTADPEGAIRRLAAFAGIPLTDALLAIALERSGRAYMLAHEDRFDDAMMRARSETRCNLPPGSRSAKVRAKGSGERMTPAVAQRLDAVWAARVAPATGFADYAAFEAAVRGL